jgi:Cohesin domain
MRISPSLVALVLATTGSLLGETISIQPSTVDVNEDHTFSLDVDIANITDLYAFQFDLGFDPTILSAISVTEGSFLPEGGATFFFPGTIDNGAGTIVFNADSLVGAIPGVSGGGTLAVIHFDALVVGTTSISLGNVTLLDSNLNPLDFSATNGEVTVQTVQTATAPEPSNLPLMAIALLWLVSLSQRKRSNCRS